MDQSQAATNTSASTNTVPAELKRQSQRIVEQLTCLNTILDTTSDHLTEMSKMMANYSPDLVTQIDKLNSSLQTYKEKAGKIYGEMSESIGNYASGLLHNLDSLTSSISGISNTIESL